MLKQANSTESAILFTPDSSKLVYLGTSGQKSFVVVNGEISERGFVGTTPRLILSQHGGKIAYTGQSDTDTFQQRTIVVEGKAHAAPNTLRWDSFTFSPDGSRFAWFVSRVSPNYLFLDGVEQGYSGASILFAPNGGHMAVFGKHDKTNRWGVFVNDTLVHDGQKQGMLLNYRAFTPDGRHFYWTSRQPQSGQRETWRLHLNGNAVVEFERSTRAGPMFAGTPYFRGGHSSFDALPFAWEMDDAGVLTFLEFTGDAIKRFRVTPSAASDISSMLAAAKAAAAAPPPAPARKTKR